MKKKKRKIMCIARSGKSHYNSVHDGGPIRDVVMLCSILLNSAKGKTLLNKAEAT